MATILAELGEPAECTDPITAIGPVCAPGALTTDSLPRD
ncbi:hypothetical protein GGR75_002681 [Xanthomonas campestris]|nr:hypothetical protein [Xanthomonas campestris]